MRITAKTEFTITLSDEEAEQIAVFLYEAGVNRMKGSPVHDLWHRFANPGEYL